MSCPPTPPPSRWRLLSIPLAGGVYLAAAVALVRMRWWKPLVFFRIEALHIVAHLSLYGALAAVCRWSGLGSYASFATVLVVGLVQELGQLWAKEMTFGGPELFDLATDALAAAVVLAWLAWRARRRTASPALNPPMAR